LGREWSEGVIDGITFDAYGVPSNIMGPHPEEFFSLMGRIVVLAALLEYNVCVFYEHLLGTQPSVPARLSFKTLVKGCRDGLGVLPEADREMAKDFLNRAEAVVLKRHTYAHSLSPAQASGELFFWKPSRRANDPATFTKRGTLAEMRDDLQDLVALCDVSYRNRILQLVSGRRHLA
jgi:hypothetical protein